MHINPSLSLALQMLTAILLPSLLLGCVNPSAPSVTHDGLVQQQSANFGTLYAKPGAQTVEYDKFVLASCEVTFKRNWLLDQNSARRSPSLQVTERDMQRIRTTLTQFCDDEFANVLEADPPYSVVPSDLADATTLILRPSIIDLNVAAPDVQGAGRARSFTTESGEMTLLLELADASTGEVLYRIVDRRRANRSMQLEWSNSVTNAADAKRILSRWGNQLRQGLDHVMATRDTGG